MRVNPPYAADEREMLIAYLDFQRESMVMKVDGLSEEQARFKPTAGSNSLAGLVSHLGWDEVWWFRISFLGEQDVAVPWTDEDPDADHRVTDEQTVGDLVAFYRAEWERSNEIVRAAPSLDEPAAWTTRTDGVPTLRWILNHMIEETARHAGHADITRELIDGAVGL
jgi:uncharacterized damage-inducible protein DinB